MLKSVRLVLSHSEAVQVAQTDSGEMESLKVRGIPVHMGWRSEQFGSSVTQLKRIKQFEGGGKEGPNRRERGRERSREVERGRERSREVERERESVCVYA